MAVCTQDILHGEQRAEKWWARGRGGEALREFGHLPLQPLAPPGLGEQRSELWLDCVDPVTHRVYISSKLRWFQQTQGSGARAELERPHSEDIPRQPLPRSHRRRQGCRHQSLFLAPGQPNVPEHRRTGPGRLPSSFRPSVRAQAPRGRAGLGARSAQLQLDLAPSGARRGNRHSLPTRRSIANRFQGPSQPAPSRPDKIDSDTHARCVLVNERRQNSTPRPDSLSRLIERDDQETHAHATAVTSSRTRGSLRDGLDYV